MFGWLSTVLSNQTWNKARLQWELEAGSRLPLEDSSGPRTITGVTVSHAWTVALGVVVAGAITVASAAAPVQTFGVTAGTVTQTLVGQPVSHQFSVTAGQTNRTVVGVQAFQQFAVPDGAISSPATVAGVPVSHQFVVDVGTVVAGGGPQTITGVPVSHQFTAPAGTATSPVTVAGVPVSHLFVAPAGAVLSPVTIAGQATVHTWAVDVGTVIQAGGLQTITGVPVEYGLFVSPGAVIAQSLSTETLPLGGGSAGDRLPIHRRVIDLRSTQRSVESIATLRVHGEAAVEFRQGGLEPLAFNPIRIPTIRIPTVPPQKRVSAPPPQTLSSSSVPFFVASRRMSHVGHGVLKMTGKARVFAYSIRWNSEEDARISPQHLAMVGLGGALVSGSATVTPKSRLKALLADDDDAVQLLLEVDAI